MTTTEDKKRHLIAVAKGLFLSRGFRATTIQAIADAANVSKGAVYLHFSSKQEIFFEIVVQLDEIIWQKVQRIRADTRANARQKLVQILETYFEFVQENRLLHELLVREVGLAMTDDMLADTRTLYRRWQQVIGDSVVELLGPEIEPWKSDLSFALNGLMESFHALVLIENIELNQESLIQFLLLLVETVGPALRAADRVPMLDGSFLVDQTGALEDLEEKRRQEITRLLNNLNEAIGNDSERRTGQPVKDDIELETLRILKEQCLSDTPNLALIQGMLANLRGFAGLLDDRQRLANLLGVKLI